MNIAFLPDSRRKFRNLKINKNTENINGDAFWLASIIENVPPDHNAYLYLANPETTYSIIHKLEGNWRKNIEENIIKAFQREFETLRENGIEIGSYEDLLGNINYTLIPPQYLITIGNFILSQNNFTHLYFRDYIPREYYVSDYAIESMNVQANTQDRQPPLIPPIDRIKIMLEKYQKPGNKKEVQFEENAKALELPEFIRIAGGDDPFNPDKQVLQYDSCTLVLKRPLEIYQPKFDKLNEKLTNLLEKARDNPNLMKRNQKKVDKLMKEMNKLWDYNQTPFSGEYLKLEVPEELPENPVFEFLITLDTGTYMATRRVAVPGDMFFTDFDELLLHLYRWAGFPYHISEFIFPLKDEPESKEASEILVWQDEDMPKEDFLKPVDMMYLKINNPFDDVPTKDIIGKRLIEYFPEFKTAQYRYDLGDNWYHSIELVGIYDQDEFDKPLPYLIDSVGVAPGEDIGGIYAFESFIDGDFDFFDDEQFRSIAEDWAEERELFLKAPGTLAPLFDDKFN